MAEQNISNNQFGDALKNFDKIIQEDPNFEVYNKKGCLLIRLEDYYGAIDCFDNSLNYQKLDNYYAHVGKSLALFNLLKLHECNASQIDWDNKYNTMMNHMDIACLIDKKDYIFKIKILNGLGQYNRALEVITKIFDDEL